MIRTLLVASVLGYLVYMASVMGFHVVLGRELSAAAEPFSQERVNAHYRVLVLGDSTAVGTGVLDPRQSVAGRLGGDFPTISITNDAVNGLRTNKLLDRLDAFEGQRFELVIIHIGGNDILYLTPRGPVARDIREVLARAKMLADDVVVLTSGDIGKAPFFITPFDYLYSHRTKKIHDIIIAAADEAGAVWVPITVGEGATLHERIDGTYAVDLLHPGPKGYEGWYEALRIALDNAGIVVGR